MKKILAVSSMAVLVLGLFVITPKALVAKASTGITVGNDTSARTVVDTYDNFTIYDTNNPVSANGTFDTFNYYASNLNPFRFVLVDASNTVQWVSDLITPPAVGVNVYNPSSPVPAQAGWNLGVYFSLTGTIPFEYTGALAQYTDNETGLPTVGQTLAIVGNSGRTYSFDATGIATPATHTILATVVGASIIGPDHGTISPSGSVVVNDGSDQTFTITPDPGYQVNTLVVDGSSVTPTTTYTFPDVTTDHKIAVSFSLIPPPGTVTVTIDKFIDGRMATPASAANASFPMVATWNATNIGAGTGSYALSNVGFNSSNAYEAVTSPMTSGASYTTNEDIAASPLVAGISGQGCGGIADCAPVINPSVAAPVSVAADCSTGAQTMLVGYSTGNSFAAAASSTVSTMIPNFTNLTSNEYVIVWNKDCLPAPVLASPLNGTTLSSADLTSANWNPVSDPAGGITYIYQASNSSSTNPDGSFVTPVYTSGPLTATMIPTPGTPEGTYFWHVMATDADGNTSSWSSVWTFTVDNSIVIGPGDVTVTIDKFIDGHMATAESAGSAAFPMVATWNAANIGSGTGSYTLSATGFNSPTAYEAVTSAMTSGASYTTSEDTSGSVVGVSCSSGDPTALVGYSSGSSLADAEASEVSLTAPNFTNLTSNEYVIVWNKDCLPAPTLTSPANGTTLTSLELTSTTWNSVSDNAGGITYIYQASNSSSTNPDGSFVTPVYTSGPLTATMIPTPGTPEGTYFWHVMATDADGNTSSWSSVWTFTVDNTVTPPHADIGITKVVDNANPVGGSTVHYTLTVTNSGPDTAEFVTANDLLPIGLSLVSATASQGTYDLGTGVWDIGTLASGSDATLVLSVSVDARQAGKTIVNTASVSELESIIDDNSDNNSASASVSVQSPDGPPFFGGQGNGGGSDYLVRIDNNATSTTSRNVTLTLQGTDAAQMEISNSSDFSSSSWQPYATTLPWTLTSGGGMKTVYVRYRAAGGAILGTANASIDLVQGEVLGASIGGNAAIQTQISALQQELLALLQKLSALLELEGGH